MKKLLPFLFLTAMFGFCYADDGDQQYDYTRESGYSGYDGASDTTYIDNSDQPIEVEGELPSQDDDQSGEESDFEE